MEPVSEDHSEQSIQITIQSLKIKKQHIIKQEEPILQHIKNYYKQLIRYIGQAQQESTSKLSRLLLNSLEEIQSTIDQLLIRKRKIDSPLEVRKVKQLIEKKIFERQALKGSKFKQLMKQAYILEWGYDDEIESDWSGVLETQRQKKDKNQLEELIQTLQERIEASMIRQEKFKERIKHLEGSLSRKGMKQALKSYCREDQASGWGMTRLRQENKVLVAQIAQASQKILQLGSQNSSLRSQIRGLGSQMMDPSRSILLGPQSALKSNIPDPEAPRQDSTDLAQQILELQIKNQNLMIQLTRSMRTIQQQEESIIQWQNKRFQMEQLMRSKDVQLNSFKNLKENLQVEVSALIKHKSIVESELIKLKAQIAVSQDKTHRAIKQGEKWQREKQFWEQRVREVQSLNQREVAGLLNRITAVENEKQGLMRSLEGAGSKREDQTNWKNYLNQEIIRLQKDKSALGEQMRLKEEAMFQAVSKRQYIERVFKQLEQRSQIGRKQMLKLRKQSKQLQKHLKENQKVISQLRQKVLSLERMESRVGYLQEGLNSLGVDFVRWKQNVERKNSIWENSLIIMREKWSIQLTAILDSKGQQGKKKGKAKIQMIQKYIDSMVNISSKNATIKQLREQIKILKQNREIRQLREVGKRGDVSALEGQILTLGTKIIQQRVKSDKTILEQQILQLKQLLHKQQVLRGILQQELVRERSLLSQTKNQIKQREKDKQDEVKLKQLQQKFQRNEAEAKSGRILIRKLQGQIIQLQGEVKTKKQLILGLKKQVKEGEQGMKQLGLQLAAKEQEVQKLKRTVKELGKKQAFIREVRERQGDLEGQNEILRKNLENLEEKVKTLQRQLTKRQQALKDNRALQERQQNKKQDARWRQANEAIMEHKETIRKLRSEVDRKDELLKIYKSKNELKLKQTDQQLISKQKQLEKTRKESQGLQRKLETIRTTLRKEQGRNNLLGVLIRRLFEFQFEVKQESRKEYMSNSGMWSQTGKSPATVKIHTPILSKVSYEGLQILNISASDLFGQSEWKEGPTMQSPPPIKKNKGDQLLKGMQNLEGLLEEKEVNVPAILQLFKKSGN